jgi:hypothetical protein
MLSFASPSQWQWQRVVNEKVDVLLCAAHQICIKSGS